MKDSHVQINGAVPPPPRKKKKYGFSEPLRNLFTFSGLNVRMFLRTDLAKLDTFRDLECMKSNFDL